MQNAGARVLIVQRRMTHYRVPLFESLRCRLAEEGVRLTVVYGIPNAQEAVRGDQASLSWGVQVPTRYFALPGGEAVHQALPDKLLAKHGLVILPHENRLLHNYALLARRHLLRGKVAFWGHGANFQAKANNTAREALKAWSSRHVDWWFAYTQASVARILANLFPEERITCLDNALDTSELLAWRATVTPQELDKVRTRLQMTGKDVGVFIGSLHEDRRIGFLLSAAEHIRERLPEFELVIIGDGALRGEVRAFAASHPWCKWVGALHGRDKVLHMALGLVMLNPGMVGLNILDAFAAEVPPVTTDCGIHSPEIAYLEPGNNGLMTDDGMTAFVDGAVRVLTDAETRTRLVAGCRESARRYTLEHMVENFAGGILKALQIPAKKAPARPRWHIAVIWQRFLPYHSARLQRLARYCAEHGVRLSAIEVASQDLAYGFAPDASDGKLDKICCFPGRVYHELSASQVHGRLRGVLEELEPDVIFAPATPFPEGMAAVAYRNGSASRLFMMDDAWEGSDIRPHFIRGVKRVLHRSIDGVFVPARSHVAYFRSLGFSEDRIVFGIDVVDNHYFATGADRARASAAATRACQKLPAKYFLFVGRLLPRKGLETLIAAYAAYRRSLGADSWELVIVGGGRHEAEVKRIGAATDGVHFLGPQFGDALLDCYGLAGALVVPSERDPWSLVVNEGMAAGLPVIVSRGCGSAGVLVDEGRNGWTFEPGNAAALADILKAASATDDSALRDMGKRSREIIADWSLDRYVEGVMSALEIPRRMAPDVASRCAVALWRGRITIN